MKLKVPQTVSNVSSLEDLKRFSDQYFTQIVSIVNGGLNFGDNVEVSIVTFTFPTANATYQVNHTLGKVPTGYIPVKKTAAADIYDGTGNNTESAIFVKSSVATTVTLMVF